MRLVNDKPTGEFELLLNYAYEDDDTHLIKLRRGAKTLYKFVNELCVQNGCLFEDEILELGPRDREEDFLIKPKCMNCQVALIYILGTQAAILREQFKSSEVNRTHGCSKCRMGVYMIGPEKYPWMRYCPDCGRELSGKGWDNACT